MELNLSSMRKKTYRQLETLSSSSPSQFSSHEPATNNCRSVFLYRKWMGFLHPNSALLCVKKNVEWLPQHFLYMEKHVSEVNKAAPVIVSVCLCNSCMCLFMRVHVKLSEVSLEGLWFIILAAMWVFWVGIVEVPAENRGMSGCMNIGKINTCTNMQKETHTFCHGSCLSYHSTLLLLT